MKWMLMALACAVPMTTATAATPVDGAEPDLSWTHDIDAAGWAYVGTSDATVMFIKPAPPAAGSRYPRVYVRFEEAKPFVRKNFPSMASVETDEIDCANQKTRVVAITRYTKRNMAGERQDDDIESPAWKAETKGSFGAGILTKVCSTLL